MGYTQRCYTGSRSQTKTTNKTKNRRQVASPNLAAHATKSNDPEASNRPAPHTDYLAFSFLLFFFCLDTPSCFPLVVRDEKGPPSFFLVSKTVFRQFQSEWSQRSRHPCSTKDFLSTSTQNSNKKTIERGKTNEACSRPTKQPFASPALLNFRWWREFVAINSGRRVTPAREK